MQKQLTDLEERIKRLEEQSQHEKPEGDVSLLIGAQTFRPNTFKTGAGLGVRFLLFRLEPAQGFDQVMDDLTAGNVQETSYSENGEVVLKGRTVEIWQDLNHNLFWWIKVEVDAFC